MSIQSMQHYSTHELFLIGFSSSPVNINIHLGIFQESYCFMLSLNTLMHATLKVV